MYTSKISCIPNSGKYCTDVICEKCGKKPAVKLSADCNGDSISLCKDHWIEWVDNELLPAFDVNLDNQYTKVNVAKYAKFAPVYEYKK